MLLFIAGFMTGIAMFFIVGMAIWYQDIKEDAKKEAEQQYRAEEANK